MTKQTTLLLVLALAATSSTAASQAVSPTSDAETRRALASALPRADSLAGAAVAAVMPAASTRARLPERRWVRTAKWSLLAAAAGFGAYALANSRTDRADSRAQFGIVGGQLALLGSVGLFIYDLRPHDHTPENIPFEQTSPGAGDDPGRGARAPR